MSQIAETTSSGPPVTLGTLFIAFLKVSLGSFGGGGGLVWARRIVVDQQHWLSDREFAEIVTLCQFLPGPNIIGARVPKVSGDVTS